jgi:hypothetical protein
MEKEANFMSTKVKGMVGLFLGAFTGLYILSGMGAFAQTPMMGLEGKSFVGQIGKKGEKSGDKDELVFKDGKIYSTACEKYGFGQAFYTAKAGEGSTAFTAETRSAKEGMMKWKGTVTGGTVTATLVWSKPGQAPQELWYSGKMRE